MKTGKIIITGSQHTRTWELDFNFIPNSEAEFLECLTEAPTDILKGLGFCLWDTINTIADENASKPISNPVTIPAINIDGSDAGQITFDVGRGNAPTTKRKKDMDIWLIPGEWYDYIPDGYLLTDICGRQEPFKRGKTDNDIRFGCLAYGILRPTTNDNRKA